MRRTNLFRGLIALALLSFTLTAAAQQKPARKPFGIHSSTTDGNGHYEFLNVEEDSSSNPVQTVITYKNDSLYNILLLGGKVEELYVNGRKIPAEDYHMYDELITRLKKQIERDHAQAERDRQQAVRDEKQAERDRAQAEVDAKQAGQDAEQAARDKMQADRDAQQAVKDRAQAERDAKQAVKDQEQAARDAADAKGEAERDREQAARDMKQAARDREQAIRDKEQAGRDAEQAVRDKEQAARDKIQAEEDKALLKSLMAEIVKTGLAPDEKSIVSLILDDTQFFVNGKKQSDELQQRFKEKYIKKEGYTIYIYHGSTQIGRFTR